MYKRDMMLEAIAPSILTVAVRPKKHDINEGRVDATMIDDRAGISNHHRDDESPSKSKA